MIVVLEVVGPTHQAGEVMGAHTLVQVLGFVYGIPPSIITTYSAKTSPAAIPATEAGTTTVTRGDQIIVEGLGIKQTLSRVITILGMQ